MSVELYLARGRGDNRRVYARTEDYDPVLRWHCRVPEPEESDPDEGGEPDGVGSVGPQRPLPRGSGHA